MFSDCIPHKRSYQTKQKYIQHLYLKHSNLLPGKGLFLLRHDKNISKSGFDCSECGKNFKRKDHLQCHIKKVHESKIKSVTINKAESEKKNPQSVTEHKIESEIIILDETFSQCSLVDISLNINEKQNESIIILD